MQESDTIISLPSSDCRSGLLKRVPSGSLCGWPSLPHPSRYGGPACGGHLTPAPGRLAHRSILASHPAPPLSSTGANIGEPLRAESPLPGRRVDFNLRAGAEDMLQLDAEGEDLFLEVGCLAELLRREVVNRVHIGLDRRSEARAYFYCTTRTMLKRPKGLGTRSEQQGSSRRFPSTMKMYSCLPHGNITVAVQVASIPFIIGIGRCCQLVKSPTSRTC
jgi:hypothetical protein